MLASFGRRLRAFNSDAYSRQLLNYFLVAEGGAGARAYFDRTPTSFAA
jgi:hypothetical protein